MHRDSLYNMDMTVQRISPEDLEEAKDLVLSLEEANLFQDAL
jgi:hypothetical protein